MGKLVRCISEDGTLTVMALDSTDIVAEAERIHQTSAVTSAALGRLLTAASMMGDQLKGADHSVTLRLNGGGPAGTVLAVADSRGTRVAMWVSRLLSFRSMQRANWMLRARLGWKAR